MVRTITPADQARRRVTTEASPPADDLDDESDEEETGPLRRCIVTRERLPKEQLIRFVVGPDRMIVPDLAAKLPGRGFWLSARGDVIDTACSRGAFARAARAQVTVLPNLLSVLRTSVARRIGEHLGFARRAGQAVCGFQKARERLQDGQAGLVIQASDGSPEERSRFLAGWTERVPAVAPLTAREMGAVFGRDHVVHVTVTAGRLADGLLHEAGRLSGLRNESRALPEKSSAKAQSSGTAGRSDDTAPGELPGADGVKAGR